MKQGFLNFVILFVFVGSVAGQNVLRGIVRYKGQPVSGVKVYTVSATTTTDNLGRYALPLNVCKYCTVGKTIQINTFHAIGANEHKCVIANDFLFDIEINRNDANIYFSGMVKEASTGNALSGISVKPIGLPIEVEPVTTNEFGEFRIAVPKQNIPDTGSLMLQAYDANKKYSPKNMLPIKYKVGTFALIDMTETIVETIVVSNAKVHTHYFNEGDVLKIEASGEINTNVYPNFGADNPLGRQSNLTTYDLSPYLLFPEYNLGALLFKVSDEIGWRPLGKDFTIVVPKRGYIEFKINTNMPNLLNGYFKVNIYKQNF